MFAPLRSLLLTMTCAAASVFALCLFVLGCCGEQAILNESVKLSAGSERPAQELIHRLKDDSPRTVAKLMNGNWTPEDGYRGRVEHISSHSLRLNRVNYNDGGYYEFTCAGQPVTTIDLEVLVIANNNLSVTEGDTATLPCYFQTAGVSVDSVEWERNGVPVFNQSLSGERRYGAGFEGRASDWSELGDLSLTVEGVKPEERGDFCCFVKVRKRWRERRERGTPAVDRVTVKERQDQTTQGTQSNATDCPPVSPVWSWPTFLITAAVFVIVGLLAGFLYLRKRIFTLCARRGDEEASQHGENIPLGTTSMSNCCGVLCNSQDDEGDEDRDSDGVQRNMLKSNH